jgi:hypothetical protein
MLVVSIASPFSKTDSRELYVECLGEGIVGPGFEIVRTLRILLYMHYPLKLSREHRQKAIQQDSISWDLFELVHRNVQCSIHGRRELSFGQMMQGFGEPCLRVLSNCTRATILMTPPRV